MLKTLSFILVVICFNHSVLAATVQTDTTCPARIALTGKLAFNLLDQFSPNNHQIVRIAAGKILHEIETMTIIARLADYWPILPDMPVLSDEFSRREIPAALGISLAYTTGAPRPNLQMPTLIFKGFLGCAVGIEFLTNPSYRKQLWELKFVRSLVLQLPEVQITFKLMPRRHDAVWESTDIAPFNRVFVESEPDFEWFSFRINHSLVDQPAVNQILRLIDTFDPDVRID